MKIPIWLASAVVAGAFALAAVAFEFEHSANKEMRDDITQLKIDVAVIKSRIAPDANGATANSRIAIASP